MSIVKIIIISFVLIAIGLAIISVSLIRTPQKILQKKDYKAQINPFSIEFYDSNTRNAFKISPFDDYYYKNSLKDNLVKNSNFKQTRNLFKEFIYTLENLFFNQKRLIWLVAKDKMQITYEIEDKKDGIYISRSLKGLDPQINAIGQSITFCEGCLLSDGYGLIFLTEDSITGEKLDQIQKLNLTPLVVSKNQLPVSLSEARVLGPGGEKRVEILISPDQQAYFYEDWHILELKTPIISGKTETFQIVRF